MFEQYKMFVDTSEKLVARRQTANRFFFSANALTISAMGVGISLIDGDENRTGLIALGIFVLSLVGILFCVAWVRLVNSFAQLNTGKFKVIHEIEKMLPIALFAAEWYVLGEGKDPKRYKSSTDTEKVVSWIFMDYMFLYLLVLSCLGCFGYYGHIAEQRLSEGTQNAAAQLELVVGDNDCKLSGKQNGSEVSRLERSLCSKFEEG